MLHRLRRKARDLRHAVQELRTGDDISRERRVVRTTIVGGRPPSEETVSSVPMGVERVLRRAAVDTRFRREFEADRPAALATCGLELTASERVILLAAPAEQIDRMIEQIGPGDPSRRNLLRRVLAAAGIALFGAATVATLSGCKTPGKTAGTSPMGTKGARADMPSKTQGERADLPPGVSKSDGPKGE